MTVFVGLCLCCGRCLGKGTGHCTWRAGLSLHVVGGAGGLEPSEARCGLRKPSEARCGLRNASNNNNNNNNNKNNNTALDMLQLNVSSILVQKFEYLK